MFIKFVIYIRKIESVVLSLGEDEIPFTPERSEVWNIRRKNCGHFGSGES